MNKCDIKGIDCPYKLQSKYAPVPCVGTQEQCDAIVKMKSRQYKIFVK